MNTYPHAPLFAALFGSILLGAACAGPQPRVTSEWQADVIWTAPHKLGGCCVGELVAKSPAQEIVAVGIDGSVHLLERTAQGWKERVVAQAPGELIQVATGDADLTRPGQEILAVGMKSGTENDGGPGMAWLITDVDSPQPTLVPLLEDTALIHGGCIAEVDPEHPGAEIIVAGFGRKVHVLSHDGAGFLHEVACDLDGPAKQVVPWRGGVAVACADGQLVFVKKVDGAWTKTTLARAEAGLARLGPSPDHLAVARDDGVLWLVDASGRGREIHREGQKLRGAVHADLEPDAPGLELACAGYEGRIVILVETEPDQWTPIEVWREDQRFHHLASGEVDPAGLGLELVACGYSGHVVVVRRSKVVH